MEKNKTENLVERESLTSMDESEPSEPSEKLEGQVSIDGIEKIVLAKTSNIQGVAELTKKIIELVDHSDNIELDASQVDSIDTSTLQVLVAGIREANQLHKKFVINTPSPSFIDAARILGVGGDLAIQ